MNIYSHIVRHTQDGKPIYYGWFESMHSRMDILINGVSESDGNAVMVSVCKETDTLYKCLDRFNPESELSQINNDSLRVRFELSPTIAPLFEGALHYKRATEGVFDIAIQTPEYDPSVHSFGVEAGYLEKSSSQVKFDFGGYAKGYALSRVVDILRGFGVVSSLISFGNSSVCGLGDTPSGKPWLIAVENPFANTPSPISVSLSNQAMGTSGNSPHHASHIQSPSDLQMVTGERVVCVSSASALDCEVYSTALFAATDPVLRKRIMDNSTIEDAFEICFQGNTHTINKI